MPMAESSKAELWQSVAIRANSQFLEERFRAVTKQWLEAREAYRKCYDAETPDVVMLRQASRRVYELEQQRAVLKHALSP